MKSRKGHPVYIIAELSANHNGSLPAALELVRLAAEAGADAVKIQTYTADTLTIDCDSQWFQIGGGTLWDGTTLHKLYSKAYTPWEWHGEIFAEAEKCGLDCFSTPFDETAVDFLEQFNPPCTKVASFELNHLPLLKKIGETKRPVILSTGMATFAEIAESVAVLKSAGCPEICLLKCTSSYPAPAEEANLARIPHMAQAFGVKAGLSDHTMGFVAPLVAVSIGAIVIEKHLCRSRLESGPDSAFSLEPEEFRQMVTAVRTASSAIGKVTYEPTANEIKSLAFRRSIFITQDLRAGSTLTTGNIKIIRPGQGLHPRYFHEVIGRTVAMDIDAGTPLSLKLLTSS